MTLLSLVLHNIARRPGRSALAVAGVALGVALGVGMACIAWGVELLLQRTFELRGTDIIVSRMTERRPIPSPFDQALAAKILALPEVTDAAAMLWEFMSVEAAPPMVVFGWEPGSFLWEHLDMRGGGKAQADHPEGGVYLGMLAANVLGKKPGDSIEIEGRSLRVLEIFESPALVENGMILLDLPLLQEILGAEGRINFVNLRLQPGLAPEEVERFRELLPRRFRGLNAYRGNEAGKNSLNVQIAKAISLAALLLAAVIGTLGVANTMLTGVHERTAEIGLLLAVGWRRRRVLALVLTEALLLSLAGAAVGTGAGIGAAHALRIIEFLRDKIAPHFTPPMAVAALVVACIAGLAGGLYPAWRATTIQPRASLSGGDR